MKLKDVKVGMRVGVLDINGLLRYRGTVSELGLDGLFLVAVDSGGSMWHRAIWLVRLVPKRRKPREFQLYEFSGVEAYPDGYLCSESNAYWGDGVYRQPKSIKVREVIE